MANSGIIDQPVSQQTLDARLREKTKETGDFMTAAIGIVNEELEKQGDLALTSADKGTAVAIFEDFPGNTTSLPVKWKLLRIKL